MSKYIYYTITFVTLIMISLLLVFLSNSKSNILNHSSLSKIEDSMLCTNSEKYNEEIYFAKKSSVNNMSFLNEFEVIKYTLEIRNNTNEKLENLHIKDYVPEKGIYVENEMQFHDKKILEWDIYELNPNEETTIEYLVMLNKIENEEVLISNNAELIIDNKIVGKTNQIITKVEQAKLELNMQGGNVTENNNKLIYEGSFKNISNEVINNLDFSTDINSDLNIEKINIYYFNKILNKYVVKPAEINYINNKLTINLNNINIDERIKFEIICEVDIKDKNAPEIKLENIYEFRINNKLIKKSELIVNTLIQPVLDIDLNIENNNNIKIKIKNNSIMDLDNISVDYAIPNNYKVLDANINNNLFKQKINLSAGEEIIFDIKVEKIEDSLVKRSEVYLLLENGAVIKSNSVVENLPIII